MHRRLAIALVSCATLALFTGSCSLLIDADRFSDVQSDGGLGDSDGRVDSRVDGPPPDAAVDLSAACNGRDPYLFARSLFLESSGPLQLELPGTYVLETGNAGRLLDPNGQEISGVTMRVETSGGDSDEFLLVIVDSLYIDLDVTLRAVGPRPLHIAAAGGMTIAGPIDVSSNATGVGAGGNISSECASGAGTTGTVAGEAGGGGAFGGAGGVGGGGVKGGTATTLDLEVSLRGGCRGGDGYDGLLNTDTGGSGGGALMLLSCDSIVLLAGIEAYGQGGRGGGGGVAKGGGGGGSGGFVGIDTPILSVPIPLPDVVRLGGGGGGGGGDTIGGGLDGQDGATGIAGQGRGNGGAGGTGGGPSDSVDGGDGADGMVDGGGGGGGGSVGVLLDLSGPRP